MQTKPAKSKASPKVHKARYINDTLKCARCNNKWTISNFNDSRKAVNCPICGEYNSVIEAIKRAA